MLLPPSHFRATQCLQSSLIIALAAVPGAYEVLCFLVPVMLRLFGWLGDPGQAWLRFWHVWLSINGCLAIGFSVWFLLGGLRDLQVFFQHLQHVARDPNDDGTVQHSACS